MKIFSREQLAQIDRQTRMEEPISEVDLMERASVALADWLIRHYAKSNLIAVFAGAGNNGGDAMAVARLLAVSGYSVELFLAEPDRKRSEAAQVNLGRVRDLPNIQIIGVSSHSDFADLTKYDLLIDGLYGAGLSRPLRGFDGEIVDWINSSKKEVISIDMPSGLLCDENQDNTGAIIKAATTLTLEFPKLSLFFAENEPYFGRWEIVPFGVSKEAVNETRTNFRFLEQSDVAPLRKRRKLFSHKGSCGHGLLLSGSRGKYGAAQLAAKGALRAGLGLLTVHLPEPGGAMLNISLPEAMVSPDTGNAVITQLPDLGKYAALAAGPGIGTQAETQMVIRQLIAETEVPLVLDADALNILAENPSWLKLLHTPTILTPHPVEFDRLSGIIAKTDEERFFLAQQFAGSYGVIVVLKGAFTRIFSPDGNVWFNSTGNPGMATAGSGDVLTGILLGLLCQGYSALEASLLGVFLHGRSADLVVESSAMESLIAGEIADYLGNAFASLK